jgi:putative Holliday junction resolvase
MRIVALALEVVQNDDKIVERISALVRERGVETIVVGMPLTLRGEKGQKALEVEEFVGKLREKIQVEVVTYDERFTSTIAQKTLRDLGVKRRKRRDKGAIDQMASALILQSYLDSRS